MRETEFKILDILSRDIGNPTSIRQITKKINDIHDHAHYPEIYSKIQDLEKKKIIVIDKYGKSSAASLNFANPLLADNLAQMELINKIRFLEKRKDWQTLILQINGYLGDFSSIRSITMIRPEKYAKLNRMELLFFLKIDGRRRRKETEHIQDIMQLLERVHNIRIDFLLLDEESFRDLLKSEDANMIKEVLSDKITIFYPQTFWLLIKKFIDEGLHIQVEKMINPAKISEQDIAYNLNRFGYQEFGTKISNGKNIGIEYITTSILLEGDARKRNAIPIILAKRSKETNYDLLMFLSKKYATIENLFPYLKILCDIRSSDKLRERIHELERSGISEAKIDIADIRKKMRLYNVE
jgi:hypothetical protein